MSHAKSPFDRAAHMRRIGAAGGTVTAQRYGSSHMRAIGKAGARATIDRHGVGYWQGLLKAKGYRRRPRIDAGTQLLLDLAYGQTLAAIGAD